MQPDGAAFAVLDLETTGFSPQRGGRVVEMAIVRLVSDGTVLDEWDTLLNPGRSAGASFVHGLSDDDLLHAPTITDVAGDVASRLAGTVLVAHNWRFDFGFLTAELGRAHLRPPTLVRLCTLDLFQLLEPGVAIRRLGDCCGRYGIPCDEAHTALGDARANARLLTAYREVARSRGLSKLEETIEQALAFPKEAWVGFPPAGGRRFTRGEASGLRETHKSYLARLVTRLPGDEASSLEEAGYLNLLDRALDDQQITSDEAEVLLAEAERWGLSASQVHAVHFAYLQSLVQCGLADGVVTPAERRELQMVARLLGIGEAALDAMLRTPWPVGRSFGRRH